MAEDKVIMATKDDKEKEWSEKASELREKLRVTAREYISHYFSSGIGEKVRDELVDDMINCIDTYDWEEFDITSRLIRIEKKLE